MTEPQRTDFLDGLRVTALHLEHMEEAGESAAGDIRQALGLGQVCFGLRLEVVSGTLSLTPGLAFSPGGLPLRIDAPTTLQPPSGTGPFTILLVASNHDDPANRFGPARE